MPPRSPQQNPEAEEDNLTLEASSLCAEKEKNLRLRETGAKEQLNYPQQNLALPARAFDASTNRPDSPAQGNSIAHSSPEGTGTKYCPFCRQPNDTEFASCRKCSRAMDRPLPQKQSETPLHILTACLISIFLVIVFISTKSYNLFSRRSTLITGMIAGSLDGIKEQSEILRKDPRNYAALVNRARRYYLMCSFQDSVDDYTKAIEINPRVAELYRRRADAYDSLQQTDLARQDRALADKIGGFPSGR
jgi:tetratricopeptide (TPR) repeat protein